MTNYKIGLLSLLLAIPFSTFANTSLTLDSSTKVDMTYGSNSQYAEMNTTGGDPHICTMAIPADMVFKDCRLEFDYQASKDIDVLQLFFRDPESEARSVKLTGVMNATSTWKHVCINIAPQRQSFNWGKAGSKLRFDFGNNGGINIKIRNLGIYGHTVMSSSDRASFARSVERYLAADYADKVTNVEVGKDYITISGTTTNSGYKLIGVRMDGDVTRMTGYSDASTSLPSGEFKVTVPRYIEVSGYKYDQLLSKWAITDANHKLLSHARYADKVYEIRHAEPGVLKTKKGIGGIGDAVCSDIDPLGLGSATFNILVNTVMGCQPGNGFSEKYVYNGKTYYANAGVISGFDKVLKTCEDKGVVVAAIILIHPNGGEQDYASTMSHPEYSGKAPYAMPDMGSIHCVEAYAATIDYLANRYSKAGNGRIHHWILHNEVDQNLAWTDMGTDQPLLRYIDTYEKSMRLVSNIVRQYDPNSYVLASFTSSWNKSHSSDGYSSKSMLDNIIAYSNAEGDFRWGIAAHPYPQDFFKPKFWDADTEATYSENSGFSTFKNIEVISDWVLRREHYYKGNEKRILFFSENGTNSLDNSTANLNVQAAGAAWAWKKVMKNAGVDAIMWHNWWDNPDEGLCLGLRDKNHNAKPSWYVWQAAGTAKESSVLDKYLSVIGISSWDQIHHGVSSSGSSNVRLELDQSSNIDMNVQYDGSYQYYTLSTTGGDPRINTKPMNGSKSDNSNTLVFEYQSDKDIDNFQVFISPLAYEDRSIIVPLKASNEWKRVYINLAPIVKQYGWGDAGSQLRIDPGSSAGCTMKIRHICINSGKKYNSDNLIVDSNGGHQCTINTDYNAGNSTIVTGTGGDPYFYTTKLSANLLPQATKLMFEYQASATVDNAQIFFVDNASEARSIRIGDLAPTNTWKRVTVDIADCIRIFGWGFENDYLRIDLGTKSGTTFKIRNICINDGEFTSSHAINLDSYYSHDVSISHDANETVQESSSKYIPELNYTSWIANATGSNPYTITVPLDKNLNADATYLRFDYKSNVDISPLEVFFMYPETGARSTYFYDKMPATSEWKEVKLDISGKRNEYGWGYAGNRLRLTLGNNVNASISLRNIVIDDDNKSSEVEEIGTDDTFTVSGTQGGLIISTTTPQVFTIYNLPGIAVMRVKVDTENFVSLPQGMYIVNSKKVIVY